MFDLTQRRVFISGQAYQFLPRALPELEGDDIHAVGMFSLIYGRLKIFRAAEHIDVHTVLRPRNLCSLAAAEC